ncbi:hypothetical protein Patl1_30888 [Pistacia atlantica]|uniref:Uncharacterized protein n=1 Tax=Pistacia atlantica TaxID=434234 RepID=A0ACC1ABV7_9ROSI|nr:hypothetical protein Patl1_30888 [Pistacia atlantica]
MASHDECLGQFIIPAMNVEFNARTAQPSSRAHTGKVFPTWVEWKKLRKAPSGPNPVGNQYPPSRH